MLLYMLEIFSVFNFTELDSEKRIGNHGSKAGLNFE